MANQLSWANSEKKKKISWQSYVLGKSQIARYLLNLSVASPRGEKNRWLLGRKKNPQCSIVWLLFTSLHHIENGLFWSAQFGKTGRVWIVDFPFETGRWSTVAFSNVHTSQDTWKPWPCPWPSTELGETRTQAGRVVKTGPCSAENTWGGEKRLVHWLP